ASRVERRVAPPICRVETPGIRAFGRDSPTDAGIPADERLVAAAADGTDLVAACIADRRAPARRFGEPSHELQLVREAVEVRRDGDRAVHGPQLRTGTVVGHEAAAA